MSHPGGPAGPRPPAPSGPGGGNPNPKPTKLLSVPTVAARLDCSPQTVYRLVHQKKLRAVPIGTGKKPRIRIAESDVDRFIQRAVEAA